jgi:hypothetical protein
MISHEQIISLDFHEEPMSNFPELHTYDGLGLLEMVSHIGAAAFVM